MRSCQRETDIVDKQTSHILVVVRHRNILGGEGCGYAFIGATVLLLIVIIQPSIPTTFTIVTINVVYIAWCKAAIGVAAITGTEEGVELAVSGCRHYGLSCIHIAELRTTAELLDVATRDDGSN